MYHTALYEDLRTMFLRTLVMYKGSLVFVSEICPDRHCLLFSLKTQKQKTVENPFDDFSTQAMRIGMVNLHTHCVYVERLPVRRWRVGLDLTNLDIHTFPECGENYRKAKAEFDTLTCSSIAKAVFGEYPTYQEAYKSVQKYQGIVAFDKQFAVTSLGELFYKTTCVGRATEEGPLLKKGFQHLEQIMELRK